ncbi:MAG: NAD(+) diphosphatase [Alphaproteobacteria bacterium]|nr:NAD(+) diphosphatase [Alphaproteobacteria bacterium]
MKPTLGPTVILDRQSEKRIDKDYMDSLVSAETSRFFVLAGDKAVVDSSQDRTKTHIHWFTAAEIADMGLAANEAIFLGIDPEDGTAKFAVATSEHYARGAPQAREALKNRVEVRTLATQGAIPQSELALAAQAISLGHWHENNRCCGRCGGSMNVKQGGWKRKCWACGYETFPRVDPVVIMAVTDGDHIVLAHEHRFPDKMYSTLAGYVEPGDDIVHAVRRETKEETGLDVGEVKLLGSQPWPFPHSLMLGCIAHAEHKELVIDTAEIEHAAWYSRMEANSMLTGMHSQELWLPGAQSMAHHLVKTWLSNDY